MQNLETTKQLIEELMINLEDLEIEQFVEMLFYLESRFDYRFSKYDIEKVKQSFNDDNVKTFRDLL